MSSDFSAKNIQYFDTLRAMATLAVIIIHVNTPVMNMNYGKNMEYWWIGLIINNLVRFAVPIFLVLSGATLLSKKYAAIDFYKKRLSRVLIPFLFWLPANWVFRWFMLRPWQRPHEIGNIIVWGTTLFIREGVSIHLWFVYMILFLYIFMPWIGRALHKTNRSTIVLFLALWLILNGLHSFGLLTTKSWPLLMSKLYGYALYAGYLVLGYYLHTSTAKINRQRIVAAIVFLITVAFACITTYIISKSYGKQTLTIMGSFTLNSFIQTIAIYYLLKDYEVKNKLILHIINLLSNYSFGIYLVHIMVISLFFRIGIFWTMAYPIISVPLVVLLTLLTSTIVIFLLRKIPFMARFAG
jgi:surface polysaccharide O-acyltransferase-like enzyme